MTVEEFLAWQSGQDQLYEFVDGMPMAMAGSRRMPSGSSATSFGPPTTRAMSSPMTLAF
jgi:hypothetical protein